MKNKVLIYFLLALPLAVFIFLYPLKELKKNIIVSPIIIIEKNQFSFFDKYTGNKDIFFQQPLKQNKSKIIIVNPKKREISQLTLPNDSWKKKVSNKREYTKQKSNGYVTFDQTAQFFIWYPQIGNYVDYYNNDGIFLWQKRESRYLRIFNHSKNILAISGDHSRMGILDPSGEELLNVEGSLFVDYKLSNKKNGLISLCGVFLGGDIVYINSNNNKINKVRIQGQIKSINCNFRTGFTIVHVLREKQKIQYDEILLMQPQLNFSLTTGLITEIKYKTLKSIKLPEIFPYTIPMCLFGNQHYFFLNKKNEVLHWEIGNIKQPKTINSIISTASPIANFRCISNDSTVALYNHNLLHLFDKFGKLYEHKTNIISFFEKEGIYWLQSEKYILAFAKN